MRLDALHPGATLDQLRETTGWAPRLAGDLAATPPPSDEALRLIRVELDPGGAYTA
jgi:glutaconate CoA-transferase subunit B